MASFHQIKLDKKDNRIVVETHRNISGLSTLVTEANAKTTSATTAVYLHCDPSLYYLVHSQLLGYLDSAGRAPSTTTNNLWLIKQGVGDNKLPRQRTVGQPIGNGT